MHGTNSLNLLPVIDTGTAAAAGAGRCGGGDGGGVSPPAALNLVIQTTSPKNNKSPSDFQPSLLTWSF